MEANGRGRRVAIYARVSTDGQTVDNQLAELQRVADRHGWEVAATYVDEGVSGAGGRDRRPGLDALLKAVSRREVDLVAAWSVDRLGRSLQHLVGFLGELHAKDVGLYLHQQGLDTTTPAGRALFQMCGVFAEFERAIMVERTKAGLARARSRGRTLGRPRVVDAGAVARVRDARDRGLSLRAVARETGLSVGSVRRALAEGAEA